MTSHAILERLLRRQAWPGRPAIGGHWAAWARDLLGRHGPGAVRVPGPRMTWLAPAGGTAIHHHHHRWPSIADRSFHPRITLACAPVLRQLIAMTVPMTGGAGPGSPMPAADQSRRPMSALTMVDPPRTGVPSAGIDSSARHAVPAAAGDGAPAWPPIARVLARTNAAPASGAETLFVARRGRQLWQHHASAHQRVESFASRAIVARPPAPAAVVVVGPSGDAALQRGTARIADGAPSFGPAVHGISEHELQRVADQVVRQLDRRLTAQRERMGRAF